MTEPTKIPGDYCFAMFVASMIVLHLCKISVFVAAGQAPLQSDTITYWDGGQRILAGDWLLLRDPAEVTRTPGYLLFVALFQATCGTGALAAAIVAQHFLLFANSLLACWACWQLTKLRSAVLLCLALSLGCFSCHGVAVNLLSDTLFSFFLDALRGMCDCLASIAFRALGHGHRNVPGRGDHGEVGGTIGLGTGHGGDTAPRGPRLALAQARHTLGLFSDSCRTGLRTMADSQSGLFPQSLPDEICWPFALVVLFSGEFGRAVSIVRFPLPRTVGRCRPSGKPFLT